MEAIVIAITVGLLTAFRFVLMHRSARALASEAMARGAKFEGEFRLRSAKVRVEPSQDTETSAEIEKSS
jgi:hypothetical protein